MELIPQLKALWIYASLCAQAPVYLPECDSFWTAAAIAAVGAVALVALYILRQMVGNFLAVRAERMRVAERKRVADEDTMAQYRADTDKLFSVSQQEDLEQRIRQAIDERKLGDQVRRPGVARKKDNPE